MPLPQLWIGLDGRRSWAASPATTRSLSPLPIERRCSGFAPGSFRWAASRATNRANGLRHSAGAIALPLAALLARRQGSTPASGEEEGGCRKAGSVLLALLVLILISLVSASHTTLVPDGRDLRSR